MTKTAKPYGPAYQDTLVRVLIDRDVGPSTFACFYFVCRKMDWQTGISFNQIAHKTVAKHCGISQRTAEGHMQMLQKYGILKRHIKGNNYDGGEGNWYAFAFPVLDQTPTPRSVDPYAQERR